MEMSLRNACMACKQGALLRTFTSLQALYCLKINLTSVTGECKHFGLKSCCLTHPIHPFHPFFVFVLSSANWTSSTPSSPRSISKSFSCIPATLIYHDSGVWGQNVFLPKVFLFRSCVGFVFYLVASRVLCIAKGLLFVRGPAWTTAIRGLL